MTWKNFLSGWKSTSFPSTLVKQNSLFSDHAPRRLNFKIDSRWEKMGKEYQLIALLHERLYWTKQINQVKTRINRAIGTLGKLRYHASLNIFRITYYARFGSHLLYNCQLWRKKTLDSLTLYILFKTALCENCNLKNVVTQLINYTRT